MLRTQVRLLCMHKSGKVVSNGPPAPPSPNKQLMLSTEVDTFLWTVAKAATAQAATDLWQPGPVQAAPLKRLQPGERRGRPTGEVLRARDTTRGPACAADIAADIAADVVVAPADEAAPAAADVGPLLSIPGFITINGNG